MSEEEEILPANQGARRGDGSSASPIPQAREERGRQEERGGEDKRGKTSGMFVRSGKKGTAEPQ